MAYSSQCVSKQSVKLQSKGRASEQNTDSTELKAASPVDRQAAAEPSVGSVGTPCPQGLQQEETGRGLPEAKQEAGREGGTQRGSRKPLSSQTRGEAHDSPLFHWSKEHH